MHTHMSSLIISFPNMYYILVFFELQNNLIITDLISLKNTINNGILF